MPTTNRWLLNLTPHKSRFTKGRGAEAETVELDPAGLIGSVKEVSSSVANDPYLQRAIQRQKVALISDDEAAELIPTLLSPDEVSDQSHHLSEIMSYLDAGAASKTGLFKVDVPDDAEPIKRGISYQEVFSQKSTPKTARTVVRAGTEETTGTLPTNPTIESILGKVKIEQKQQAEE